MRLLVCLALALGLVSGCSSPQVTAREIPLTHDEARAWVRQERAIEDARSEFVEAARVRHGLDPRTVFDPTRGVLIAPVTSASAP